MMSTLFRPSADPFSELNRLQGYLDQLFRPAEGSSIRPLPATSFPVLNVGSTPDTLEVMALAPGLDPASLQLSVDRGLLIIAGERPNGVPEADEQTGVYAQERFYGSFRRVITLPDDVDPTQVDATYRDGVLRVTLARHESAKPRRIEVK
jgi:HSP20 family protein